MGFDCSANDHRRARGNNTSEQLKISYADSAQEWWMITGSPAQTVSIYIYVYFTGLSNVFLPQLTWVDRRRSLDQETKKGNPLTINTNFSEIDFESLNYFIFRFFFL